MSTDADSKPAEEGQLADRFRALLDQHGYGFQYAVIRKLDEIFRREKRWLFEVAEFPTLLIACFVNSWLLFEASAAV